MKKQMLAAVAAFALAGSSAWAQAPQAEAAKDKMDKAAKDAKTVTGCLKAGEDGKSYTFTDSADSSKSWSLVANQGVNLAPHVGHTVKITGKLDAKYGMSADRAAERATSPARPASAEQAAEQAADAAKHEAHEMKSAAKAGPQFHVEKIEHVSASCEAPTE